MIAQRIPVLSGGFSLAAFMAQQSDGFWYDFTQTAGLFQTTDTSTPVTAFGDNIGRATDLRAAATATQSTTSFRPKYQSTGAAFDGADDNLLTGYTAGSGANFLVAKVVVPASIAATQVICGAWVAGPTEFFFLGLSTTGLVRCGVGGVAATASAGSDLRGTEAVIGLSFDATTVRMFAGGAEVNSAPRSGNPTTVTPVCIGATNAAGSASNPFGGSVKSIVAGRQFLDLSTFNKIAAAL